MPTIKFDDYLEKRLKEPEFKTSFENENAKLNLALALVLVSNLRQLFVETRIN